MQRGPHPTPTEILKLHGSYDKKKHGPRLDNEIITKGKPIRPTTLSKKALQVWDSLVPHFEKWGHICEADTVALTEMCRWYAVYRKELQKFTEERPDASLRKALDAFMVFDRIASRYGITPADRARIKVFDLTNKEKKKVAARERVS